MNGQDSKELFVLLGTPTDQRFQIFLQMAEYLMQSGSEVGIILPNDFELDTAAKSVARLLDKNLKISRWKISQDPLKLTVGGDLGETNLLLAPGDATVVDLLESLSVEVTRAGIWDLQRVTTWVDCENYLKHKDTRSWYECCFHFSDLVLLDCFKNQGMSALKEIRDHLKKESLPCIVENTKKDRLQNHAIVMDNQVRRISQVFESSDDPYADILVEIEEGDEDDDVDAVLPLKVHKPYFERNIDGKRSKPIPNPVDA